MFELLIFGLATSAEPVKLNDLHAHLNEKVIEYKIETNHNDCNTAVEWISAEDASCIPKWSQGTPQPIKSSSGQHYTIPGQCVTHVASMRHIPPGWGNAINWKYAAQAAGWYVGPTPIVGAVGWRGNHVVYVEEVRESTVVISERNYDWNGSYRKIERPINHYTYLY